MSFHLQLNKGVTVRTYVCWHKLPIHHLNCNKSIIALIIIIAATQNLFCHLVMEHFRLHMVTPCYCPKKILLFCSFLTLDFLKITCIQKKSWWYFNMQITKEVYEKFSMKLEGLSLLIHQTISPPNFSAILQCLSDICSDLCSNFLCNCYTL